MSGHSKWASIKHKKAVVDQRRGQHFTKLTRAITVAAREGGGDIDGNPALGLAVQKARDASMPKDNIERAIAKGTGEGVDADQIETVLYEGYGPGGVALLIEAVTDNRNRTGAEMRNLFSRNGGNMAEPGAVGWQFERKGIVTVGLSNDEDKVMEIAMEGGAEDMTSNGAAWVVTSAPADVESVRQALDDAGITPESVDLSLEPTQLVPVPDEGEAKKVLRLLEAIDDHDDVQAVHSNADIADEVLATFEG
jgi:YebC/PmpR family DNA-binding regulatory protein